VNERKLRGFWQEGLVPNRAQVRYLFRVTNLPTIYPLEDLFDAAVRHSAIRLTCRRCGRVAVFSSHALWWRFRRRGWADRLDDVRKRCLCLMCLHRDGEEVRNPELELVDEAPTDTSLPKPTELDWKRELRRRR
jgi:hypothetical protein